MTEKTQIIITAKDETKAAFKSAMDGLDKLKAHSVGVSTVLGGLGGALTVAGFANAISATISFAAALDDMAEATGASVENLSALSSVAKIGGHDLGAVEAGLMKLAKALHASDEVSKGAGKALEALGLNLKELRGLDTAEAMLKVAQAFDEFKDGSGKSAVATAIFKGEAKALLPYLKDLAEQHELVGKVTAEQAAQAEQYEKNIKKLAVSFGALAKEAALSLVPALASVTSEMVAGVQASGGWINYLRNLMTLKTSSSIPDQLREITAEAAKLEDVLSIGRGKKGDNERLARLQDQLKMLRAIDDQRKKSMADSLGSSDIVKKKSLDDFVAKDPKEGKGTKEKADEAARLISTLKERIALDAVDLENVGKLTTAERERAKTLIALDAGTLKATASQRAAILASYDQLVASEKLLAEQEDYRRAQEAITATNLKNRQAMLDQIATAEEAADLFGLNAAQISVVEQARLADAIAIARQNGASEDQIAYLEEELALRSKLSDALIKGETKRQEQKDAEDAIKQMDEMGEFAKQAAKNMQDAMADFFINPTKDGMQSIAETFGQTVQKMIAQAAAAQLGKLLFGDLDKTGSIGADSIVGKIVGSVDWASLFSFANGGIMTSSGAVPLRKYATGGVANSPQFALFGEGSTPEAYVPLPDGRRIPVQMAGGGDQRPVVINVNSQTGDPAEIRRAAASGARTAMGFMNGARRYG